MAGRTLGLNIALADAMIRLHETEGVRAFRHGKPDNTFFDLCKAFLQSMRKPDGEIDFTLADLDILDEMNAFTLSRPDITDEDYAEYQERKVIPFRERNTQ